MSEAVKTYKVKLAKHFHKAVADGTRLSNLRHTRGGVTLSSPEKVETVVELTKDQVEAIKNDPAFEITVVNQSTATPPAGGSKTGTKPAATGSEGGEVTPPADTTTPPAQGAGSQVQGVETDPNLAEKTGEGDSEASELPEDTGEGAGDSEGDGTTDGPVVLDEAALKALKKGNRDGAVAAATERGIEVTDQDTKAQIVDKIAAKQTETQE